ncbi:MAG: hypothetical protein ABEH83_01380 [Halobacterium sp.]
MKLRDRLGVSERRQRQAARAMQAALAAFVLLGVVRGSVAIVVNAGLGLLVTHLPAVLERDYSIPMDAGLTLWITATVFLHAVGVVGLPGLTDSLYGPSPPFWYDHLTHFLSSTVVAAAGYATVRALDEHHDDVAFPPEFTFVFVVLFVVAMGVLWELVEYATWVAGRAVGADVLVVYGVDDVTLDLLFNAVGAVVVGVWGTAYLADVADAVRSALADAAE